MTIAKIDLVDAQTGATSSAWNVLKMADTSPQPILDINGVDTGWTMRYDSNFLPGGAGAGYDGIGVGDAAWVDDSEASRVAVYVSSSTGKVIVSGPESFNLIRAFGSHDSTNNTDVSVSVNSGAVQVIPTYDSENNRSNNSEIAEFTAISADGNGDYIIEWSNATTTRGYLNALYLEGDSQAAVFLDAALEYGGVISGTYANFAGVPASSTSVTITDSNRTITVPVTVTDNGAGGGSFTGTMPSLPSSGQSLPAGSLVFPGNVNITLTDPGA